MVRGLWIQRSGAGSRGDEGPNAPMVLGTNSRKQFSRARSNTLCRPEERRVGGGGEEKIGTGQQEKDRMWDVRDSGDLTL